jgi:peptide/nickel transport system substrate-binding protein
VATTSNPGSAAEPDDRPVPGGTLRVAGSVDADHLDTASGYLTQTWALSRNYARTLFNIRGSAFFSEAVTLRPDVAREIPDAANGGLSADRLRYTIRLREGVMWNTDPPREVSADDFIRGLKRLGNPAQPCGGLSYYCDTIDGMAEFCAGYSEINPNSIADMARYQSAHSIRGLRAHGAKVLEITLRRPASDFLRLLSLQFSAAAPAEYDRYLPDSPEFRENIISDGPYQPVSCQNGVGYRLARNPAWRQDSDPIRAQHVDAIHVDLQLKSPETVQDALEEGTADLSWDQRIPTARIPELLGRQSPQLYIAEEAMASPYLVFNVSSPNNSGALANAMVRQAISYAIDKTALADVYGGQVISEPLEQIIPPRAFGHQPFARYATTGRRGDPELSRNLLAEAGWADGLTLRFPFRTTSSYPAVAELIASDLRRCGITVLPMRDADGSLYRDVLHNPNEGKAGQWDIATPGWVPDWYGNNGRTSIVPLFDGRARAANSPNFGGYDSPAVNEAIDAALHANTDEEAASCWHRADQLIMEDAPVVPLLVQKYPLYRSARVRNACYLPAIQSFEYSQIWLAG